MNCLICLEKLDGKEGEYHRHCLLSMFGRRKLNPVLPFSKAGMFGVERLKPVIDRMSISGVQMKLSVKIEKGALAATAEKGEYILKPSPPEFPNIAENEHLSMLIGKVLGIETPSLGLFRFMGGELTYLTKRFDRKAGEKLRKEDMCQIFGIPREEKYSGTYEDTGKKILEVTGDIFCAYDFFKRTLFNYLIANGDFHLKNISLMKKDIPGGNARMFNVLSPNYDSVNTRIYIPQETELALYDGLLNGDFSPEYKSLGFYSCADFTELGRRLGIDVKAVQSFYQELKRKRTGILALIDASFLPDDMKSKYKEIFLDQFKKLFQNS